MIVVCAEFVLYARNSGKIVLQKRDNIPNIRQAGKWCIPGGHKENDEGFIDTVIREVYEETGIHVLAENCYFLMDHNVYDEEFKVNVFCKLFVVFIEKECKLISSEGKMYWKTFKQANRLNLAYDQNTLLSPIKNYIES